MSVPDHMLDEDEDDCPGCYANGAGRLCEYHEREARDSEDEHRREEREER